MARPRIIDIETGQTHMLGVCISAAAAAGLKAVADARGCSMAAVVRPLIDAELRRCQAAAQSATHLIGAPS